ncbi:MAG: alpha/beta fold hydrolase [Pirellulales bacterium]
MTDTASNPIRLLGFATFAAAFVFLTGAAVAQSETKWNGFVQKNFQVDGRNAFVVVPEKSALGKPWIWRTEFFGHEPQGDIELIKRGWHAAYVDVQNMYGSPKALDHMDRFYDHVTKEFGLAPKVVLEGFSRGGLFALNWAARHPDRVSSIYNDAPVCDFESWPGGKGAGPGSNGDWERCLAAYGLTEDEALAYRLNPIDNLVPLAQAKIPLLHICGDADEVVPFAENTELLVARYRLARRHDRSHRQAGCETSSAQLERPHSDCRLCHQAFSTAVISLQLSDCTDPMPALRFIPDRASTTAYLLLLVLAVAIAAGFISSRELPISPLSATCIVLGLLVTGWLGLNYADQRRASGSVRRVVATMFLILGAIGCVAGIAKQAPPLFAYGSSSLFIAWLFQFAGAAGLWTLLGLGTAVLLPAVQISSPDISQRLAASAVRFASWSLDDWNVIHQSAGDYLRLGSVEWEWRTGLIRSPFSWFHFLTVSVLVSLIRHRGALVGILSALVSIGFSWLAMSAFVMIVAYGESTWHRNLATGMDATVVQSTLWISAILCFIIVEWFISACAAPVPPPGSESDFVFATCNILLHWPQPDPTAELEHDDDHPASASSKSHSSKAAVSQQRRDDEEMTLWGMWRASLSRPSLLTQGAAELAVGWLFTRRLLPILSGAGLFALCGLFIASGVRGQSLTELQLIKLYNDHLKLTLSQAKAASEQPSPTGNTSVASDTKQNLIQARLFELGDDTPATIYAAALAKSESGGTNEARELFRKIAPNVKQGYPPAHAWLAADMLAAQSRSSMPWTRDLLRELLWHLSYGTDAPQAGPVSRPPTHSCSRCGNKEQATADASRCGDGSRVDGASGGHGSSLQYAGSCP